jgi:hypothetical protein
MDNGVYSNYLDLSNNITFQELRDFVKNTEHIPGEWNLNLKVARAENGYSILLEYNVEVQSLEIPNE